MADITGIETEQREDGRWWWIWRSPNGAEFPSPAMYATEEAALHAGRSWVAARYRGELVFLRA